MEQNWDEYRRKIIGLGDSSMRKSYFPELQEKIQALETNQSNLQSIINVLPVGVVVHTDQGKVLSSNPQATELLGLGTHNGQKKTLLQFQSTLPDIENLKSHWQNALKGEFCFI